MKPVKDTRQKQIIVKKAEAALAFQSDVERTIDANSMIRGGGSVNSGTFREHYSAGVGSSTYEKPAYCRCRDRLLVA